MLRKLAPLASLLLVLACDLKRDVGEKCTSNDGCKPGLVCVQETCADGTKVTKQRLTTVQKQVQTYMHEHGGECPDDLVALNHGKAPEDAWGRPITMVCPGSNFVVDLRSFGPDGTPENEDDVLNVDAKVE